MATTENVHGQETENLRTELDIGKLGAYLERNSKQFAGPWSVKQFKLGQSNPTFLMIDSKGLKCVVRKKPPGALLSKTAHAIEREFLVLKCLREGSNVPVPRVYLLCEDSSVLGTPFYCMEFIEGRIFSDNLLPSIANRLDKFECYYSIVKTLVQLHNAPWKRIGLERFGRNGGYYQRQIDGLLTISRIQAAVNGSDSVVGELYKVAELETWMKEHVVPDQVSLVHGKALITILPKGDFKTDNIIFHEIKNEVVCLLDWELSTIGNPFSDLANLLLPWYIPHSISFGAFPGGFAGAPRPMEIPEAEELINLYCKLSKQPVPKNWTFCVVFALFRLAVISQGIAARVKRKQANSAYAEKAAQLFTPISFLAHSLAFGEDLSKFTNKAKI